MNVIYHSVINYYAIGERRLEPITFLLSLKISNSESGNFIFFNYNVTNSYIINQLYFNFYAIYKALMSLKKK